MKNIETRMKQLGWSDAGRQLKSLAAAAVIASAVLSAPASAVDGYGLFELDGNAADGTADLPDDWQTLNGGRAVVTTGGTNGIINDPAGATIFTGGGSKDIYDIPKWSGKSGSVPDKDEITNTYAGAYRIATAVPPDVQVGVPGDLVLYAGLDRFDTSGDANVGFWFFQNNVSYNAATGKFSGTHSIGDLLVVASFSGGGKVGQLFVYEWNGTTIVQVANVPNADCSVAHPLDQPCGRSNNEVIQLSWPYVAKNPVAGPANRAPPGSFVEVGVNLSRLSSAIGITLPCFSSFLAETRSSTADNSVLKDFAGPVPLPVCSIAINKSCGQGTALFSPTRIQWPFSGTVTNNGAGTLYDLEVTDSGVDQVLDTADDFKVLPLAGSSLAPGASIGYSGSFITPGTTPNPSINITKVVAAVVPGGPKAIMKTSNVATCLPVVLDPNLSVTKQCSTTIDLVNNQLVVGVNVTGQVCNTGTADLTNVRVTNNEGASAATTLIFGPDVLPAQSGPASCKTFTQHYRPSAINAGTVTSAGTGMYVPTGAEFADTVTASGTSNFDGRSASNTATATCPLCTCTGDSCPPTP